MKKLHFFACMICFFCMTSTSLFAADLLKQIHPYVKVKGEYNDNLYLTTKDQKSDYIATVTPGVRFSNMDNKSGVNLDANAGGVFYKDHDNLNYLSSNINFDSKYLTSSRLNFYLKNAYTRSEDPREREYFTEAEQNKFVLSTETTRGVYWRNVVSPTVEFQFGPESRIGATYRNNVYQTAADGAENSVENYISPFITVWFNRQNGISLAYAFTNGHFERSDDFNSHKVNGSYMLRFTPKATASLNGAYTRQKYNVEYKNYVIYEPSAGLSYQFSPTLSASAQVGYYWLEGENDTKRDGMTFKADITQRSARTTFLLSVQGGYTQDVFTAQNLGFTKYYRATGSIHHYLAKRFSVGCLGSYERSESEPQPTIINDPGKRYDIYGAGVNAAYDPFKWLRISAEYTYNQKNTNYRYEAREEYIENKGMLTLTATY